MLAFTHSKLNQESPGIDSSAMRQKRFFILDILLLYATLIQVLISVADPGFPKGGGRGPVRGARTSDAGTFR